MSKWTDITAAILNIEDKVENGDYEKIEKYCADYIAREGKKPEDVLAGARLLLAHSKAMNGKTEEAREEHEKAMMLLKGKADGSELLNVASEAMNHSLPDDYCASLMHFSAERLTAEKAYPNMISIAYNKEGICLYKAEAPLEQEAACFEKAEKVLNRIKPIDDDDLLLRSLVKSNLAECRARGGDLVDSAALYRQSISLLERRKTKTATGTDQYAVCQRNLSDIYRHQGETLKANTCLNKAINALEEHPDGATEPVLAQLASCLNARGTLRYSMGDYAGEVEDCTASIKLRKALPADRLGTATVYSNLAEAYEQLERYFDAAVSHGNAVAELGKLDKTDSLVKALTAMQLFAQAKCVYATGDVDGALKLFVQSAAEFGEVRGAELNEYSSTELTEMESLCRFRLSHTACEEEHHNYHLAMSELNKAITLLAGLEETPSHLMELSVMHTAMGELYEMFDEQECAADEYSAAEELRGRLAESITEADAEPEEEGDDEDEIWADPFESFPKA